jgi:dienelactone hydrolase
LLKTPPDLVTTLTATDLQLRLAVAANQVLLGLSGAPVCDIGDYKLRYNTVGAKGEATTASAALLVPNGTDARCHGARPVVLYAHGTSTDKAYDISDLKNDDNGEGLLIAAQFAAQGYIVVAPNYTGYDTSTLAYHPYLLADAQSKDMIDALAAARTALAAPAMQSTDSGKLFVTGYSQGGYVAMATHRALEAAGATVTASAPMSGPYALTAFFDAVFSGQVNGGAPVYFTFALTAYQQAYGNIYTNATDVFEAQYASGIEALFPSTLTRGQLYAQGKLPQNALFNSTPPDLAYASITPATQPATFAALFAQGFGTGNLIRNSYRLSYLNDARTNPDGGWPTVTSSLPPASPALGLRQALKSNDLRSWTPKAPTLLCGGQNDPVVYWLNAQLMQSYWSTRTPAVSNVTVVDVEASPAPADAYASLRSGFSTARQAVAAAAVLQGANDAGASAVLEAYHATLVSPYCLAAARMFFTGK